MGRSSVEIETKVGIDQRIGGGLNGESERVENAATGASGVSSMTESLGTDSGVVGIATPSMQE
jgi:hypothetical protein